jgi:hypothetical protein
MAFWNLKSLRLFCIFSVVVSFQFAVVSEVYACHLDITSVCHDGDEYLGWRLCNNESGTYGPNQVEWQVIRDNGTPYCSASSIEGLCGGDDLVIAPGQCVEIETPVQTEGNRIRVRIIAHSWRYKSPGVFEKDECGICGGNGPDVCGRCPDEEGFGDPPGICGCDDEPDECGRCPDDQNYGQDPGICGCDDVPDQCGRCPEDPDYGEEPGVCGCDDEPDECGRCPDDQNYGQAPGICGCEDLPDECGICPGEEGYGEGPGECGCNSDLVKDCAGVCGGNAVEDCAGICGGNTKVDCAGICGGNTKVDCRGVCGGDAVIDDCGICEGNNKYKGCDDVCFSGAVVDQCGVCGGDGSTCGEFDCIEQAATKKERRRSRKVVKTARILKQRTDKFSKLAEECQSENLSQWRKFAKKQMRKLKSILDTKITNSVMICSDSVCTKVSTGKIAKRLRQIIKDLFNSAKKSKSRYIINCAIGHHGGGDSRKVTEDYRDDALKAVKKLPKKKTKC